MLPATKIKKKKNKVAIKQTLFKAYADPIVRQYNLKLTKAGKMLEKDSLYVTSTEMMHKIFPHYLYWCLVWMNDGQLIWLKCKM